MRQNNNNIPLMVYQVLDKDTIRIEIIPHLSVAKRGFHTISCLIEVVNSILYKLKTGCQRYLLPIRSLFSDEVLNHKTIFGHFRISIDGFLLMLIQVLIQRTFGQFVKNGE